MSDRAIVHGAAYNIGVPLRALHLDVPVQILERPIGPHFFLVGRQEVELWLQNSQYGGLAGEVCEGRGLKTEAQVKFSAERMAVPQGSICLEISST